jgi:hypothetical protein
MKIRMPALSAMAMIAVSAALAGEPTGLQRDEVWGLYFVNPPADPDPNDNIYYDYAIPVPCLGPAVYMEGTEHVVLWYRQYVLPTGAEVFSFKFRNDIEFHDQDGNTWTGSGEVHGKDVVLAAGESHEYVAHILFKPVLGNLGMWQMRNVGMIRVKADGKIVVDRPPYTTWQEVERCVPAKRK